MIVDRDYIINSLVSYGLCGPAERAAAELPPEVDTARYADLLDELGLDPTRRAGAGQMALRTADRRPLPEPARRG